MKQYLEIPKICPICGEPTYIKDDFVYCSNPNCEGKFINLLCHFCGKKGLDIKGLSEATLQKLIDWGWVGNYQELFSLSNFRDEWIKKPGFGPKSVDKLLETIEAARHCELWQFISALSIPLIGSTYAKEIAKRESGWLQFMEDVLPHMGNKFDFTQWSGFGPETDYSLHNFNYNEANILATQILDIKNSLWVNPDVELTVNEESAVAGKTFCVTGKVEIFQNRDALKTAIEAKGGKVVSAISKSTNYLVTNDPLSGSSKNVKAQQYNIPIISERELIALL